MRLIRASIIASEKKDFEFDASRCAELIQSVSTEIMKLSMIKSKCTSMNKISTQICNISENTKREIEMLLMELEKQVGIKKDENNK